VVLTVDLDVPRQVFPEHTQRAGLVADAHDLVEHLGDQILATERERRGLAGSCACSMNDHVVPTNPAAAGGTGAANASGTPRAQPIEDEAFNVLTHFLQVRDGCRSRSNASNDACCVRRSMVRSRASRSGCLPRHMAARCSGPVR